MTPWRLRCPQGHASIEPRQDDTYYCDTCGCKYPGEPLDATTTDFPVDGIERIEAPDADDVLAALDGATRTRPSAAVRQLPVPTGVATQRLLALRDAGLVETTNSTGRAARWRLTAAGRARVGDPTDEQPELVADGGRPVATDDDGEHDVPDSKDATPRDGDEKETPETVDIDGLELDGSVFVDRLEAISKAVDQLSALADDARTLRESRLDEGDVRDLIYGRNSSLNKSTIEAVFDGLDDVARGDEQLLVRLVADVSGLSMSDTDEVLAEMSRLQRRYGTRSEGDDDE